MNDKDQITDIVPSQEVEVAPISRDALEIIESRNKLWERVMNVALKATTNADWVDQNGKPYLQASGAEKVARRFGVRIFDVEIEREDLTDEKGRYYLYTVTGKAALGAGSGDVIETIGTCSSRDKFFGKEDGELKPVENVDIANIKKKAYTNFLGNAITRLLGLRGLTWDHLKQFNISSDGKTKIKYKGKPTESTGQNETAYEWPKGCPAWDYTSQNGNRYVNAKLGRHFSVDFLKSLNMKPSDNDEKKFWGGFTSDLADKLCNRFFEVEEALK